MIEPRSDKDLKWVGIDFDNTIAHNSGLPDFIPSKPLHGTRAALKRIERKGFKIIIYTARSWNDYEKIEDFMLRHDLPFRRIICGKPLFYRIIDDRNIEFNGDWGEVLDKLND